MTDFLDSSRLMLAMAGKMLEFGAYSLLVAAGVVVVLQLANAARQLRRWGR